MTPRSALPHSLFAGSAALGCWLGCTPREPAVIEADQPITVADAGFATPESVLHDAVADVYLVSNINGTPFDVDDNGFISRLAPSGEVLALRWIDGALEGVTLNAPKGMAILGEILYVSDIDAVRMFDRNTGAPLGEVQVPGSTFLNDLAAGLDGAIYFTDSGLKPGASGFEPSGTDAVYRLSGDRSVEALATGDALGRPNGIAIVDGEVWVVSFGSGELYRVVDGAKMDAMTPPGGSLDGLEPVDGEFLISSWGSQAVLRGPVAGPFTATVDSLESPADIGFDRVRRRVLIPLFSLDQVRIVPLP